MITIIRVHFVRVFNFRLNLLWRWHDIHTYRRCNDTDAHTTGGGEIKKYIYFFCNIRSLTVKLRVF